MKDSKKRPKTASTQTFPAFRSEGKKEEIVLIQMKHDHDFTILSDPKFRRKTRRKRNK